jgi:hypothetical protein
MSHIIQWMPQVDPTPHDDAPAMPRRVPVLDLFYLAIAALGFLLLWGITKACERV